MFLHPGILYHCNLCEYACKGSSTLRKHRERDHPGVVFPVYVPGDCYRQRIGGVIYYRDIYKSFRRNMIAPILVVCGNLCSIDNMCVVEFCIGKPYQHGFMWEQGYVFHPIIEFFLIPKIVCSFFSLFFIQNYLSFHLSLPSSLFMLNFSLFSSSDFSFSLFPTFLSFFTSFPFYFFSERLNFSPFFLLIFSPY